MESEDRVKKGRQSRQNLLGFVEEACKQFWIEETNPSIWLLELLVEEVALEETIGFMILFDDVLLVLIVVLLTVFGFVMFTVVVLNAHFPLMILYPSLHMAHCYDSITWQLRSTNLHFLLTTLNPSLH